jgi:hypothetical protein
VWEDEHNDHVTAGAKIRSWPELREEIKKELAKGKKALPLSKVNQYFILRNFATLRIKGLGRIAASKEIDETVKATCKEWLTSQPSGQITPRLFKNAINSAILPALNIAVKKPICERTARRWLVKLGWRLTVLRKGVYMDGHERADVRKYRDEVFLPAMARFEARMVRFEGPELKRVEPMLNPGEKRIIANFHDECSFHVNDYKARAW